MLLAHCTGHHEYHAACEECQRVGRELAIAAKTIELLREHVYALSVRHYDAAGLLHDICQEPDCLLSGLFQHQQAWLVVRDYRRVVGCLFFTFGQDCAVLADWSATLDQIGEAVTSYAHDLRERIAFPPFPLLFPTLFTSRFFPMDHSNV